jgi:hypothetical protein
MEAHQLTTDRSLMGNHSTVSLARVNLNLVRDNTPVIMHTVKASNLKPHCIILMETNTTISIILTNDYFPSYFG